MIWSAQGSLEGQATFAVSADYLSTIVLGLGSVTVMTLPHPTKTTPLINRTTNRYM